MKRIKTNRKRMHEKPGDCSESCVWEKSRRIQLLLTTHTHTFRHLKHVYKHTYIQTKNETYLYTAVSVRRQTTNCKFNLAYNRYFIRITIGSVWIKLCIYIYVCVHIVVCLSILSLTHTHTRSPVSCHAPSRLVPTFPLSHSHSLSLSVGSFCLALLLDALYIYILYTVCTYVHICYCT